MDYTKLKVTADGGVAVVSLADPSTRNALGPALCVELTGALEQIDKGLPAARCVLLTGEGGAFCSGANLEDAVELATRGGDFQKTVEVYFNPMMRALRQLSMPVVVAVPGPAAGIGASLAFMGDIIVASETAIFAPAFATIGLIPDGGASWLLPRLAGKARAMEMALLGDRLTASQALDWGLINRVVAADRVMPTAMEIARRLAEGPSALAMTRRLILDGLDGTFEKQLDAEAKAQGVASRSDDFKEGLSAFFEKRKPKFRGR